MSGHRVVNSSRTHFYSATKFAITAITEGLRQELREMKSAIKVTVSMHIQYSLWTWCKINIVEILEVNFFLLQGISPGLVRTEFAPRLNKAADIEEGKKQYDEMVDGVRQNL